MVHRVVTAAWLACLTQTRLQHLRQRWPAILHHTVKVSLVEGAASECDPVIERGYMLGNMQEGFGCTNMNQFDHLVDDESDPLDTRKATNARKGYEAAAEAKQPPKDKKAPLASSVAELELLSQPVFAILRR